MTVVFGSSRSVKFCFHYEDVDHKLTFDRILGAEPSGVPPF